MGFYLVIEDVWKKKIIEAYGRSCLEEIEKNVLNFNHKIVKDMIDDINNKCLSLTNTENKYQFKRK